MIAEVREELIRKYFNCWIFKDEAVLRSVFSDEASYFESHTFAYKNLKQIILWFQDWIKLGTVFDWNIKQFWHSADTVIVEWYFNYEYKNKKDNFEGVSIIKFDKNNKIIYLKEFKCDLPFQYPYD